jgi:enoyl-CoA hydratase/carnithine racemase
MRRGGAISEYKNILYRVDGAIARMTLNRPEKRNELSLDLHHHWLWQIH